MSTNEPLEDYPTMIAEEFRLQGFRAHTRDVDTLARALEAQGAEFGEVGVCAAVAGYIAAYRGYVGKVR